MSWGLEQRPRAAKGVLRCERVQVLPYPWSSLERVPRSLLRRVAELREPPTEFAPEGVGGVLSALVGTPVEFELGGFALGAPARRQVEVGSAGARRR